VDGWCSRRPSPRCSRAMKIGLRVLAPVRWSKFPAVPTAEHRGPRPFRHRANRSCGLVHRSGCHHTVRSGNRSGCWRSVPELAAREGSTQWSFIRECSRSGHVQAQQQPTVSCFMPPESWPAGRATEAPEPVRSTRQRCGCGRSGRGPKPNGRAKKSTFSLTVSVGESYPARPWANVAMRGQPGDGGAGWPCSPPRTAQLALLHPRVPATRRQTGGFPTPSGPTRRWAAAATSRLDRPRAQGCAEAASARLELDHSELNPAPSAANRAGHMGFGRGANVGHACSPVLTLRHVFQQEESIRLDPKRQLLTLKTPFHRLA